MQQTQPLSKGPISGTRSQPLASTSQLNVASAASSSPRKGDTLTLVLGIFAFLTAGTALYFTWVVFKAAEQPESHWVYKIDKLGPVPKPPNTIEKPAA